MLPVSITAYTLTSAVGAGKKSTLQALRKKNSGLHKNDFDHCQPDTWIGRVQGVEEVALPDSLARYTCRNNQLAIMGLEQDGFLSALRDIRSRYGSSRIAVIVGTSTSGVHATELAYRDKTGAQLPDNYHYSGTHDCYSLAGFLCELLELSGPSMVISTACSSSAKVFATAQRYLSANLCDAALVGGVDTLCLTTLYGFDALQLLSTEPCKPFDRARDGLSIGEAAGFAILQRGRDAQAEVKLLGVGESSDAHHMSAPHPEGLGAVMAMSAAMQSAGLVASDIDYVNLHGTATSANDLAEDIAMVNALGTETPCSSTKGLTGHTLGAAGITEAVISALCLEHGLIPGNFNTQNLDPIFQSRIVSDNYNSPVRRVLSNSFGFGGTNCSLLFGRGDV